MTDDDLRTRIHAWFHSKVWARHVITRPCRGCADPSVHDAHLTRLGLWWLRR